MPLPPVVARVRVAVGATWIESSRGTYTRAPRFSDAAAALRMAHPDRAVKFVFDHPGCAIGQHGRQVTLMNAAWIDGEEQLVVTWRDAEGIPLFCLHELIYNGGSLEESRYVDVAGEHLADSLSPSSICAVSRTLTTGNPPAGPGRARGHARA